MSSYFSYEDPVETIETGPMKGIVSEHPCFATISASRRSGGKGVLFQSGFKHNNMMAVTIQRAKLHRGLSNDWVMDGTELIEVEMSEAQWATFISTPNAASTPCTLKHLAMERVPQLPEVKDKTKQFKAELKQAMIEGQAHLDILQQMIKDSSLSQKQKDAFRIKASQVGYALNSNIDFVASQFGEHVENTVEAAKIEVNAYMTGAIARAGIKYLSGEAPPLMLDAPQSIAKTEE